jgi:hypothetical protein
MLLRGKEGVSGEAFDDSDKVDRGMMGMGRIGWGWCRHNDGGLYVSAGGTGDEDWYGIHAGGDADDSDTGDDEVGSGGEFHVWK